MTYSYNPAEIAQNGISRARFELGDTMVDGEAETCMLSDEEIQAVIAANPKWKRALYKLADGVCMRLSYEVDWRDDGTSFSLSQRADRWLKMRERLKKEADAASSTPVCGAVEDSTHGDDGGHYFYAGMMQSPIVQPPYPYDGRKTDA